MLTPDNKINPVRKDSVISSTDDDDSKARKPPSGDFEKVAKEVDERDKGHGNEFGSDEKPKKKVTGNLSSLAKQDDDTPLLSPFQLARNRHQDGDEEPKKSLKDLYDDMTVEAPKPKKVPFPDDPVSDGAITPFEVKTTRYSSVEQPDIAEINPLGDRVQPTYITPVTPIDASMVTDASAVKTPQPMKSIQEVIDQIVEKVYTVKQTGDTETVVDLKGSFAGSRLIVTESDSARGQFNITIDNLTGPNQALIEAHRAKIMDTLLESGVQVQRFTASTTLESARIDVATDDTRERNEQDNPQEDNPRDGRRQKSDDKT